MLSSISSLERRRNIPLNGSCSALDLHANVVFSYIIFVGLGRMKMDRSEQAAMGLRWTGLPLYWLMLSAAAWRAVLQLRTNPFFWDKTRISPVKSPHSATSNAAKFILEMIGKLPRGVRPPLSNINSYVADDDGPLAGRMTRTSTHSDHLAHAGTPAAFMPSSDQLIPDALKRHAGQKSGYFQC